METELVGRSRPARHPTMGVLQRLPAGRRSPPYLPPFPDVRPCLRCYIMLFQKTPIGTLNVYYPIYVTV